MKHRSKLFIAILVVATAVSAFLGGRAIVGATSSLRSSSSASDTTPGEIEATGSEAAGLMTELGGPKGDKAGEAVMRDPLSPYTAPAPPRTTSQPKPERPALPSYVVTAVFLDEDPTAVVVADGKRTIVHVGDELGGARVTSIGPEGVTIKGADGVHTYTYSAAR